MCIRDSLLRCSDLRSYFFACLQPGHYDAGMKGQVMVTKQAMAKGKKAMPKDEHEHKH